MNTDRCDDCLAHINALMYNSTESTKFATFFYGVVEPGSKTLNYANGGHDAPILLRKGQEAEFMNSTGLLLGVMAETEYTEASIQLESGDLFILYTDGITEAMNAQEEEFGLEKLVKIAIQNRERPADEIKEEILAQVKTHANGISQSDDITLLIIKAD